MESNVLSWNAALQKGHEPRLYPYATETVPFGRYYAVLDFKIWAKKAIAIGCYFTQKSTGIKFQVTVYRRQTDKLYRLEGGDVDFKVCPVCAVYAITVFLNGAGNVALRNAVSCGK
ncbi:hypothetical protein [Flavisolibacter nicotianae]|uniref:hypothetical protein n=1 Tax=Flavisolibacter nicotianae TaxID=2364882 RepID=UPI000EB30E74|nr:hypothetical protein [Flavisolibacter nicotianae]